ncbi:cyclin-D-binding Myb-like transcription factor 1 [Ylistrum balloti]|uniref:cyclin-D-binding Myb-like transcription factor 1 n=1 Tax=Ylistrum balloti TaxID=509963 RepID=UPI0029059967|nr:cyclin-D-binding Myb-like transcription factor 1 [Ylistrum balloti]
MTDNRMASTRKRKTNHLDGDQVDEVASSSSGNNYNVGVYTKKAKKSHVKHCDDFTQIKDKKKRKEKKKKKKDLDVEDESFPADNSLSQKQKGGSYSQSFEEQLVRDWEESRPSMKNLTSSLTLTDEEAAIVHTGKISSTLSDMENFRLMGIKIRTGKWVQQEDDMLMENFENIKNEYPLDMDNGFLLQILFINYLASSKEERDRVKMFCKHSDFYIRLAGRLRRSPESIVDRARKILPNWKTGPFSPEEEETLLSLHKLHGNRWSVIGYEMNRSRNSVMDHYQIIKDGKRKKGTWTEEETNLLLQIISEEMETDDLLSLPHFNMPWAKIGKRMPNRNGKQCRSHWVYQLRPLLVQGGKRVQQVDKVKFIAELCNLNVETEKDIDWEAMLERIPEAGTPQQLQQQWQKMKLAIFNVERMTFDEIRDFLSTLIDE